MVTESLKERKDILWDVLAISANELLPNNRDMLADLQQQQTQKWKIFCSRTFIKMSSSLPECCVNMFIPGSGTFTAVALPGGVPVLQPDSRGLLPATLPRFPFPWCGWDAWGCGGWIPVDVTSPTRPTCCPIPVVLCEDVWDEASNPRRAPLVHIPPSWCGLNLNPVPAVLLRLNESVLARLANASSSGWNPPSLPLTIKPQPRRVAATLSAPVGSNLAALQSLKLPDEPESVKPDLIKPVFPLSGRCAPLWRRHLYRRVCCTQGGRGGLCLGLLSEAPPPLNTHTGLCHGRLL